MVTCAACAIVGCSSASPTEVVAKGAPASVPSEHAEQASRAVVGVKNILAHGMAPKVGVRAGEVDRMTLGDEVPVRAISPEELAKGVSASDLDGVLGPETERVIPVLVDGHVRSLVGLERGADGQWAVGWMGRPNLAQSLDTGLRDLVAKRHPSAVSLLNIPQIGQRFLAHEEGGQVMLTALHDTGDASFAAGATVPAKEAFARLSALHPAQND